MSRDPLTDNKAPISEHLAELRVRLVYSIMAFFIAFCVCYYFSDHIYGFLVKPLYEIYGENSNRRLIYTGLTEAFFTYVKLSMYAALIVSFPIIATQIYIFLAPGLYKNEKMVLVPFLVATPILFGLGAALVYYFIIPAAWKFFISFESMGASDSLPIQLEARVGEYLSLIMQLIFAFGLAFQLPILLTLLAKIGFVNSKGLASKRKYAIVIILIIAAIITPPDVISQIGLALPMMLLYEGSIIICKFIEKKKEQDA